MKKVEPFLHLFLAGVAAAIVYSVVKVYVLTPVENAVGV